MFPIVKVSAKCVNLKTLVVPIGLHDRSDEKFAITCNKQYHSRSDEQYGVVQCDVRRGICEETSIICQYGCDL